MARIKIENVIDHLGTDFRRALADAVSEVMPGANIDEYELFRAFKRAVGRKCSIWERVPDHYIRDE